MYRLPVRRTVGSIVRTQVPKEGDLTIWTQEVIPAVRELQRRANDEYANSFTHTTPLTSAFETAYTSDDLPPDSLWRIDAEVTAICSDGSCAVYWIRGAFKRVASAAASQVGSTASLSPAMEDVAGWDVRFSTSGNTVLAQVKGDATRTVDWTVRIYATELV